MNTVGDLHPVQPLARHRSTSLSTVAGSGRAAYVEAIEVAGPHQSSYGREAAGVFAAAVAAAMAPGATVRSVVDACLRLAHDGTAAAIEAVCSVAEGYRDWSAAAPALRAAVRPFDTLDEDFLRPGLGAHRPSRLHAIEELPVALGILLVAGGDHRETVLGAVNYGRDSDSIANMGGAIAGALGGLAAVPAAWVRAVAEGSMTDRLAPADLMADVAAEVFDLDRQRYEDHRMVLDRLVR